jgi:MarR family transcriptional regulator for hemolysin
MVALIMPSPKTSDALGFLLAETARKWRSKLDQRLRPLGLSQAQWVALIHLSRGGEPMVQKELAERIGIEGPTLVRLLDRMARDGWIVRRDSDADRRAKTVHLTDRAVTVIDEIQTIAGQLRRDLLKSIPVGDLETCASVLRRIQAAAEALEA